MSETLFHTVNPVFDQNSKILILGSFPSPKSRELNFFYSHPQNRFWRVLAAVLDKDTPMTVDERRAFALDNHIALWDVIHSCTITGASDSSIKDVVPNDISIILDAAPIAAIFTTGNAAYKYYCKYLESAVNRKAIPLKSTSPANAAWSFDALCEEYRQILPYLI